MEICPQHFGKTQRNAVGARDTSAPLLIPNANIFSRSGATVKAR